jgi:hypothetical protein
VHLYNNIKQIRLIHLGPRPLHPVNIRPLWGAFVNVYAYHQAYTANDPSFVAIDRWTAGGYAQTTFTLPWDLSLELNGWIQSPSIWAAPTAPTPWVPWAIAGPSPPPSMTSSSPPPGWPRPNSATSSSTVPAAATPDRSRSTSATASAPATSKPSASAARASTTRRSGWAGGSNRYPHRSGHPRSVRLPANANCRSVPQPYLHRSSQTPHVVQCPTFLHH